MLRKVLRGCGAADNWHENALFAALSAKGIGTRCVLPRFLGRNARGDCAKVARKSRLLGVFSGAVWDVEGLCY